MILWASLLVVALLATGGWLWWSRTPPAPVPDAALPAPTVSAKPPTAAASAAPNCSRTDLAALPGGLAALRPAIAACGAALSVDDLMSLLENSVSAGNAEALLVMGKLYDKAAQDPDFEGTGELALGDSPALAAEYYTRAKTAGSADAAPLLTAVCQSLATADDVLSQGARDDFCR